MQALADYAAENEVAWEFEFEGSIKAAEELRRGDAAIAILAEPDDMVSPLSDLMALPLAYQTAVIAVNDSNPLNEISFTQLNGLFSSSQRGAIGDWGGLGLDGIWQSRKVNLFAYRSKDDVVLDVFRHSVLQKQDIRPTISYYEDAADLGRILKDDSAAVAILPTPRLPSNVRALAVSGTLGGVAFKPTASNIHLGDYPLRLPFVIHYRKATLSEVKPLLLFLLSDPVANRLQEAGFVPVPRNERRDQALLLQLEE